MVKFPRLISPDSRDDLYHMLPNSVRMALRSRLKASNRDRRRLEGGVGKNPGLIDTSGSQHDSIAVRAQL
ncbi:hypothetical protein Mapa_000021 [Marchantia paleacea]|nr:hypothetical protein Mapa_000021 [Marchantia paleacea]